MRHQYRLLPHVTPKWCQWIWRRFFVKLFAVLYRAKFGYFWNCKISFIFDFWPKLPFLTKISIFDQNFGFWPKFRFLTKISIFDQNYDFTKISILPKFPFFTKISTFDQNFDLCGKFRFLRIISFFWGPEIPIKSEKDLRRSNFRGQKKSEKINPWPLSGTENNFTEKTASLLSDALAITCLFETVGVFGMPMFAGYLADRTQNMGMPLYVAGGRVKNSIHLCCQKWKFLAKATQIGQKSNFGPTNRNFIQK